MAAANTIFSYNLQANQPDSHQSQPWCLIVVLRFKNQNTFESPTPDQAFLSMDQKTININDAVAYDTIFIRSDILSATVSTTKNSFVGTANAILVPGQYDYQYVLFPGDHAFIWMHNDIQQLSRIVDAVRNGTPANDFNSGLKFYGRVDSVMKVKNTTDAGMKSVRYQIGFKSFSEFNSQIYFNPAMRSLTESDTHKPNLFWSEITAEYGDLFSDTPYGAFATPNSIINGFINVFLGNGPGADAVSQGGLRRSPTTAYVIPKGVGQIFGETGTSNGAQATYSDVLNTILGVQQYLNPNPQFPSTTYAPFVPQIKQTDLESFQRDCQQELMGYYAVLPDLFSNTSIWSIIQSYLNSSVNEIYTTMKCDENGDIFPTFIARQIPFSTAKISALAQSTPIKYTLFTSLPRWVVNNNIRCHTYTIGTSDVMRVNFVQFYGKTFGRPFQEGGAGGRNDALLGIAAQSSNRNFKLDPLDIFRNGGRNKIQQSDTLVNLDPTQASYEFASNYSSLVSDWYINGHLRLTGTAETVGIVEPICVGDNLEHENLLFHIETLTHTYSMNGPNKKFMTSFQLSNGMNADGSFVTPLSALANATIQNTEPQNEPYNVTVETNNTTDENSIQAANTTANNNDIVTQITPKGSV